MINLSKSIAEPNLRDVLNSMKDSVFSSMNCCKIGVIDSFSATNQTASIQIVFKAVFEGQEYDYPVLVDCPCFVLGGADKSLQIPIKKGDHCIVLFNDVNIDNWYQGSLNQSPESNRRHDLSDGIALVGIRNLQNRITDFANDKIRLINGSAYLELADDENIELANSGAILSLDDNGYADLSGGDSNITLKEKINLGNTTSDLKTLLDNLIDQIKAIVTVGSPASQTISPASQIALDAIKTQIGAVFE